MTTGISINVALQRWPAEGVFTSPIELAQALADLNEQHGYRGTLHVGDGEVQAQQWVLELGPANQPGTYVKLGDVLVYYLSTLRCLTPAEYETLTGSAP